MNSSQNSIFSLIIGPEKFIIKW